jgi:hypothetical protein
MDTKILEKPDASTLKMDTSGSLKCWYLSSKLHSIMCQKDETSIINPNEDLRCPEG